MPSPIPKGTALCPAAVSRDGARCLQLDRAADEARPMTTRLRKIQARCPAWWWKQESVCPSQKRSRTY
eukprot:scaffold136558_cov163-Phaeocystis_antarctica.AAC.1